MMMLSVIPVSAKTAIVPGIVINQAKGTKDCSYGLGVGIAGKAKLKSGTYSAELLVPADLFVKDGFFFIEGQLGLHDASIDRNKEDDFLGTVNSTAIFFMINSKGKISIKRHDNMKDKWVAMGSASVKAEKVSSGKYYLVTIKNMPYDNTYIPRDVEWRSENAKSIPANKTFYYEPKFHLFCDTYKKAVKDCFYLASFSLNTGVKTLALNFAGNFNGFNAWHNIGEKELPVTMKISRVSY
jgi:hypothetical protein